MSIAEFKKQLRELQNKKFYGLNDRQLFSYIRIYYAIYLLISVNALDEEYGDRKIYSHKLQSLLRIMLRRYDKTAGRAERVQILYMVFFIMEYASASLDRNKYWNMASEHIDEYIAGGTFDDENELYIIMRMIFVQWYGLVEDDENETPCSLVFARNKINEWAGAMHDDGHWDGIDGIQALHRIILISMNSTMMLDDQYDAILEKAYQYYCIDDIPAADRISLTAEEIEKYTVMYYALQQAPICVAVYNDELHRLSQILENHQQNSSTNAELRTRCHCITIDNTCMQVAEQIQDQLFAE